MLSNGRDLLVKELHAFHDADADQRMLEEQLELSKQMTGTIEALIDLEQRGVLRITGGSWWPSCVEAEVVDKQEYDRWYVQTGKALSFPSRFLVGTKREGPVTEADPPAGWAYGKEDAHNPDPPEEARER